MLKRFVSLLLAAVMLLSLVGCTDTATEKPLAEVSFLDQIETGSVTVPETDYVDTAVEKPLTVESVLALINTDRLEEMSYVPESIMEISQSHEYDNLLSHEECQMLLEEKYPTGDVTKEQAIEDAEYLWKAFASAYGGYYYFGDDTFKNAHQQMIFRQFVSDVEEVPIDSSGRILIPKRYLQMANIQQEVRFIGMDDTIEIWAKEKLEQPFMDAETFSREIEKIMTEKKEDNNNG